MMECNLCHRTTIQIQELKRFVSFTQVPQNGTRFLYYFCLCKSFKELLFAPPFPKAGAKVHTFSELPKLFWENFHLSCKILPTLDQYQDIKCPTPYYII